MIYDVVTSRRHAKPIITEPQKYYLGIASEKAIAIADSWKKS